MKDIIRLIMLFILTLFISGCDIFDKYTYCGGKGKCCKWTTYEKVEEDCLRYDKEDRPPTKHRCTTIIAHTVYDCVDNPKEECVGDGTRHAELVTSNLNGEICDAQKDTLFSDDEQTRFVLKGTTPGFMTRPQSFEDDQLVHFQLVRSNGDPASLDQRLLNVAFSNDPLDCKSECSSNSEFCIYGSLTDDIKNSLLKLYTRLGSLGSEGRIYKSELMKIFNQTDDPCNRDNTVFTGTQIVNTGKECVFSVPIPDWEVEVEIGMPTRIAGSWSFNNGDLSVAFADKATSMELRIDDEGLDSEWGGRIRSVRASREKVHFETENGCMAVGLNDWQ